MNNIKQKALALLNAEEKRMGLYKTKALSFDMPAEEALCRTIEQHEAFRQEVSDALKIAREHIEEQITHTETRIQDGIELGATVWRIALEDIVRENRAALAALKAGGQYD